MMDNVIELHHVHKSFEGFHLKDFSMTVKKRFCHRVYRWKWCREIDND